MSTKVRQNCLCHAKTQRRGANTSAAVKARETPASASGGVPARKLTRNGLRRSAQRSARIPGAGARRTRILLAREAGNSPAAAVLRTQRRPVPRSVRPRDAGAKPTRNGIVTRCVAGGKPTVHSISPTGPNCATGRISTSPRCGMSRKVAATCVAIRSTWTCRAASMSTTTTCAARRASRAGIAAEAWPVLAATPSSDSQGTTLTCSAALLAL